MQMMVKLRILLMAFFFWCQHLVWWEYDDHLISIDAIKSERKRSSSKLHALQNHCSSLLILVSYRFKIDSPKVIPFFARVTAYQVVFPSQEKRMQVYIGASRMPQVADPSQV